MSLISPLDRDLALVYPRLAPVRLMELLAERGIEVVEVPDEEFESMGCQRARARPASRARARGERRDAAPDGAGRRGRRHLPRRPHLAARRRWPDLPHAPVAAGAASSDRDADRSRGLDVGRSARGCASPLRVEGQLAVLGEPGDADADEPERARAVAEPAVEQSAGELGDPVGLVDRGGEGRRAAADREVGVPQLRRHRSSPRAGA